MNLGLPDHAHLNSFLSFLSFFMSKIFVKIRCYPSLNSRIAADPRNM